MTAYEKVLEAAGAELGSGVSVPAVPPEPVVLRRTSWRVWTAAALADEVTTTRSTIRGIPATAVRVARSTAEPDVETEKPLWMALYF